MRLFENEQVKVFYMVGRSVNFDIINIIRRIKKLESVSSEKRKERLEDLLVEDLNELRETRNKVCMYAKDKLMRWVIHVNLDRFLNVYNIRTMNGIKESEIEMWNILDDGESTKNYNHLYKLSLSLDKDFRISYDFKNRKIVLIYDNEKQKDMVMRFNFDESHILCEILTLFKLYDGIKTHLSEEAAQKLVDSQK